MSEYIGANWLILSPIILLSVAAVGLIIEKAMYFWKIRWKNDNSVDAALKKLGSVPVKEILEGLDDNDNSPGKELLEIALTFRMRNKTDLYKKKLEASRDRFLDRMDRHLALLPGIGNVATLLGLFGTVSGMITAFTRMTETGSSDPYVLAGGISRALVTTAAGLAVAIPAMFFNHLFEAVSDRHADQMEEVVNECLIKAGAANERKREPKTP